MKDRWRYRPAVLVFHHPAPGDRHRLREIGAGMEEEGVPYRVEDHRIGDGWVGDGWVGDGWVKGDRVGDGCGDVAGGGARELAFAAARASGLGVGVGVDAAGNICVHHAKLPPDAPAMAGTASDARVLGHNAARLVAGVPFKQFERQEDPYARSHRHDPMDR
ncbi:glycerol dehydratase reactivase beta/small subunit family protein [Streptosporangium sp. NPDC002721]|uniref:glycerol dehydratase reactivase beta/small subunit family protein n=1 Tax=Streptosporangium sp. NPDC002721 TaxID=3366188 RepID=UPI00368226EE